MKKKSIILSVLFFTCIILLSCNTNPTPDKETYSFLPPDYSQTSLVLTPDTIDFPLDSNSYNKITTQNVFTSNGITYIAFFDDITDVINIYQFDSSKLIKKVPTRPIMAPDTTGKITAYVIDFDSIIVVRQEKLKLIDSALTVKHTLTLNDKRKIAWTQIENTSPPLVKNGHIYTSVAPLGYGNDMKILKKWKVLFDFNLDSNQVDITYDLPSIYKKNYYGYHFLDYCHCVNDQGNIVFSFPADTLIHESDLNGRYQSYYAKSHLQQTTIAPIPKDSLADVLTSLSEYLKRPSYSSIYFDPYHHRYLRLVRDPVHPKAYHAGNEKRTQRIIIFDSTFKIIGESEIDPDVKLKLLFFTPDGTPYARVFGRSETSLHFVKLAYIENNNQGKYVTQKKH